MGRFGVRHYILFALLALVATAGIFVVQRTITTSAAPGINKTINFQGKMTDDQGLNVADGTYQFEFRMYTVASGGSATWTETVNLTVTDGIFHHNLGSTTPLPGSVDFDTDNIYLGITFNSDPDGEMTPRIQLTATPYAFNTDQLDGLDASDFLQLSPSAAQSGDIAITGSVSAASLVLSDGSSNTATIEVDSLSGDYTYVIPTTTGDDVFCLEALGNCGGSGSGVSTIGTIDSQTASANGAVISGSTLYLQSASASNPGVVNTGTQAFAGDKTFGGAVKVGGAANVAQFTVKLNSAQTAPAMVIESSTGFEMARLIVQSGSIGLGSSALSTSSTGSANVAIGLYSMMSNGTGGFNVALGTQSLFANDDGSNNTAIGFGAMMQNQSGNYNVALGPYALGSNSTGEYNIGIGASAGSTIATGSYNIAIGYNAAVDDPDASYQLNIVDLLRSDNYLSGNLVVGASDTTGQLLVLDTKTSSGDPTGINGGMYYNSNDGKFRCYEDGAWKDCISAGTGDIINGGQNGAVTIGTNNSNALVLETNNTARISISSAGHVTQTGGSLQLTGTTTANYRMYMTGTVQSASSSLFGIQNNMVFEGSSASGVYGLYNTPTIHASSGSIPDVFGFGGRVDFQSGYAGTVTNAYGVVSLRPSAMNGVNVQNYIGLGAQLSNSGANGNSDNTSGTLNNFGLRVFGGTAAAGTGGTLNNYGARITLSTGATSGTTNYGVYIDGNGGGSNNWALYSTSTAASLMSGALTVGGQLSVGASNSTGTLLVLDTKTGSGDSGVATVNGGMYYNSADGKFRCYENGTWKDCISSSGGGGSLFTDAGSATYLTATTDNLSIGYAGDALHKLAIVNTANQSVLGMQAYSGQTAPLIVTYDSSGDEMFRLTARDKYSLFLGYNAGASDDGGDNENIGIGHRALQSVTDGSSNIAIGAFALQNNEASNNVAIGSGALTSTTTGGYNIAIGSVAANSNNGEYNVTIGHQALQNATDANDTVAIGTGAGSGVTTGDGNMLIGYYAGDNITSGSRNIIIGYEINAASATNSNQLNIAGILTSSNYLTGNLVIGTSNTTGQLLVLDVKTSSGDPSGVNGGMYYNSNAGAFRFYQNGNWYNLGTGDILNNGQNGAVTIGTNNANSLVLETNNTARLTVTSGGTATWNANTVMNGLGTNSNALSLKPNADTGSRALLVDLSDGIAGNGVSILTDGSRVPLAVWNNTAGYDIFNLNSNGNVAIRSATDGTGALQVQNAAGDSVFTVDTNNAFVGIGTAATGAHIGLYNAKTFTSTIDCLTTCYGTLSTPILNSPTNAANGIGMQGGLILQTGSYTTAYGIVASNIVQSGASTTTSIGVYVPDALGSGAITNQYGLYIASQTRGSSSNYAVFTDGTAPSYFGGNLQFANSTGNKLNLYSTTYGIGIESSTLTNWSSVQFRWRVGGSDPSSGTQRMLLTASSLTVNGTANCVIGSGTGATSCTSDSRKKHDVAALQGNLDKITQLNPVSYYWNSDPGNTTKRIGLIAQDVKALFPEAVDMDNEGFYTLDYAVLVSPLIGAVKELSVTVSGHTQSINVIESDIAVLTAASVGYATTASVQSLVSNLQARINVLEQGSISSLNVAGNALVQGSLSILGDTTVQKITIAGKIVTAGVAPVAVLGTHTGTGATHTLTGNDTAGEISFISGASQLSDGEQASITFSAPFGAKPRVNLTATSPAAAAIRFYTEQTETGFKIIFIDAPAANKTYSFNYFVVQSAPAGLAIAARQTLR